jgi:hypothetical protein
MLSLMCLATKLLNDPSHASHSHTVAQSHDCITSVLADLATQHGLPTSIKSALC